VIAVPAHGGPATVHTLRDAMLQKPGSYRVQASDGTNSTAQNFTIAVSDSVNDGAFRLLDVPSAA